MQESVDPCAKKRKVHDIINYDPRAPVTCCTDEEKQSGKLLYCLQNHKQVDCMWLSLLKYNYKDYFLDDDHTSTLNKQRKQLQNLKVKSESNFSVELVKSKVLLPGLMNVMFV